MAKAKLTIYAIFNGEICTINEGCPENDVIKTVKHYKSDPKTIDVVVELRGQTIIW